MYDFKKIEESKISNDLMKKIKKEALMIYKPNFEWYGLYDKDILLCVIALGFRKTNYRVEAIYTIEQFRGYGIASNALNRLCELYNFDFDITADCLDSSVSLFQKVGFQKHKTMNYKICNIHKCSMKRGTINGKQRI